MIGPGTSEGPGAVGQPLFATTHWSVVVAAADQEKPEAAAALERLCRTYWYPLYAYIRRRGHSPEDAQDLTQEFFYRLLERSTLAAADRAKGRFRSFLLGTLKHFLADEQDKTAAQKRGGGRSIVSWEEVGAGERFAAEPADQLSPDKLFDRRWALTVLDQATTRLRDRYQTEGSRELFDALSCYLTREKAAPSYAETAARLGLSETAVASAIFRLRRCYYSLIRAEVAQTVSDPQGLQDEIHHLMNVFSRPAASF